MLIMSGKKVADVILKMELMARASLSIKEAFPLFHSSKEKMAEEEQILNYLHLWTDKK